MQTEKTVLITGATGGIGTHLSREFARHGCRLVLTARDPEKLRRLAGQLRDRYGVRVWEFPLDLNQENSAAILYRKLTNAAVDVDVLVNNAGFGLGGYFSGAPLRRLDAMGRVNMLTPTRLCRLLLPGMLRRGRGGILNIASTGSYVPGPYNAVYCVSKAYLLSLTEALAWELRGTPLTVSAVCPGGTHTGFAQRAGMESTWLFRIAVMDPQYVAREAYRAFAAGKPVTVIGPVNKAMIASLRLVPRIAATAISAAMQKLHGEAAIR